MSLARRALVLAAATAALLAPAACSGDGNSPTPRPPPPPGPTAALGTAPTDSADEASTPPPTTAPPPPSYPSGAKAYAQAILTAWKNTQTDRLGDLTSPEVQEQIMEIPGPINQAWHYQRCEGAAGSSYCVFFNDVGDMIRLKLVNEKLGQAHAGTGVVFDQVQFPTDAVAYVNEFIDGWQQGNTYRMKILANATEVAYFTHYTPPEPGYSTCTDGAAGSAYVRVYNAEGLDYVLKVSNATVSSADPHAIVGHVDPPVPPACP